MPIDKPERPEEFSEDAGEDLSPADDVVTSGSPAPEYLDLEDAYDAAVDASRRDIESGRWHEAGAPVEEEAGADVVPEVAEEDEGARHGESGLPEGVRPLTEHERQNLERGLPPDHAGPYTVSDPAAKREEIERARGGYEATAGADEAEPNQPTDRDLDESLAGGTEPDSEDGSGPADGEAVSGGGSVQAGETARDEQAGASSSQGGAAGNGKQPPGNGDETGGGGPDNGEDHEGGDPEMPGDREGDGEASEPGDGGQDSAAGSEEGDRSISDIIGTEHLTRIAYDFPIGTVDDVFKQASEGHISPVEDSVAAAATLPPGAEMVVADIGAGTGNTASSWRATLEGLGGINPDRLKVVALDRQDLSHESMDPHTVQDCEAGRVDYRVGDAVRASEIIGSGTAQFVMVHRLLDLVDDPETAVKIVDEAIKVATPGGTIYIDGKDETFDPESSLSFPQAIAVDDYLQELAQRGYTVEMYQDMPTDDSGEMHLTPFYKITKSGTL